jgi:hypothetical protein
MTRKVYTKYRRVLEELKLRQLDVYRFKDRDVLRVMLPDGSVKLVELPRKREEMTLEEFKKHILSVIKIE